MSNHRGSVPSRSDVKTDTDASGLPERPGSPAPDRRCVACGGRGEIKFPCDKASLTGYESRRCGACGGTGRQRVKSDGTVVQPIAEPDASPATSVERPVAEMFAFIRADGCIFASEMLDELPKQTQEKADAYTRYTTAIALAERCERAEAELAALRTTDAEVLAAYTSTHVELAAEREKRVAAEAEVARLKGRYAAAIAALKEEHRTDIEAVRREERGACMTTAREVAESGVEERLAEARRETARRCADACRALSLARPAGSSEWRDILNCAAACERVGEEG